MSASPGRKQNITFPNSNKAVAVTVGVQDNAQDIVSSLGLAPYQAVILILGGADGVEEKLMPQLAQLFGRGIARAAAEANAVIVDGGLQAGVMSLMGEGVASRGYKSGLVGVAPAGEAAFPGGPEAGTQLEPNHSHFVLVEGIGRGGETATMYKLAAELIKPRGQSTAKVPALAVLAGGGQGAEDAAVRAVRQNLPLIVVEGSGGLADEIAAALKKRETAPEEPLLAEIVAEGEIHVHPLAASVKGIERLIIRELGVDKVLTQAWEVFADYDLNAGLQQKRFGWIQFSILAVGVAGTALAIIQQLYAPKDEAGNLMQVALTPRPGATSEFHWWLLRHALILMPILLTVLVTAANRFKQGNKWMLLRAGAESIKREIYRYRARAMYYKENAEYQLSQKLEDITRRTMRTEVNLSALRPYNKQDGFPPHMYGAQGGDDGFSYLTPDRYVEVRLGDQLSYFQKKSVKLERQLKLLYWATFIVGGVGAYLAAIEKQVWIALTTALVAAIGTYLGYRQTENTLTKYNQAATDLANVKAWWNALSAEEQARQENIDSLVEHTEQVLQTELDGWVQQMQNALAELRKGQEPAAEREENREPREADERRGQEAGEARPEDAASAALVKVNGNGAVPPPVNADGNRQQAGPAGGEEAETKAGKAAGQTAENALEDVAANMQMNRDTPGGAAEPAEITEPAEDVEETMEVVEEPAAAGLGLGKDEQAK